MIGGVSRLRALAASATPGPWVVDHGCYVVRPNPDGGVTYWSVTKDTSRGDAEFIAAANPEVVSALCDVYEASKAWKGHSVECDEMWIQKGIACTCGFADLRAALARLEET